MKPLYLLIPIYVGLMLSSCADLKPNQPVNTQAQTPKKVAFCTPTDAQCSPKNPLSVAFYANKAKLKKPYVVLGKETIARYNSGGIKRQEANIHDAMRTLAASAGGDAIVDIKHNHKTVTGTIIAFEKSKDSATHHLS